MKQTTAIIIRSLVYGMSGIGLFRRLTYPGAPKYAVDPRPVDEILGTTGLKQFEHTLLREAIQKTKRVGVHEYDRETAHQA